LSEFSLKASFTRQTAENVSRQSGSPSGIAPSNADKKP
jgi:hypothetical protein